jgi:hypothetical protein
MTTPLTDGAAVAAWLGLPDTQENADKYELVATVADEHLRLWVTVPASGSEALNLAATMLAARLAKRATTPEGLGQLGGDSVYYVARTDPDLVDLISAYRIYAFA